MKIKIGITIILIVFLAFTYKKINSNPWPTYFPKPNFSMDKSAISQNKIDLGRVLFYDPILSRDNSISCASCHNPYNAFAHTDHNLSHGINDRIGTRNAPVLFNLAWQKSFMWDGSINHIDMQALAPISRPDEMGEDIAHVVVKLKESLKYRNLFFRAYGDSTINSERTLKSISQFLLSLISSNSKFDSMILGKVAFTSQELNGYNLFKKNCNSCHQEPLFSTFEFKNNGLNPDTFLNDVGRFKVSLMGKDSFKFKIPTLRNIEFSYPYMHDGRFKTLKQVLNHYNTIQVTEYETFINIKEKINLSSNEKVDIISFLRTLTDKKFLFDSSHAYPKYIK